MKTATGVRTPAQSQAWYWGALAVVESYYSVPGVSYLVGEVPGGLGVGTTFVCAPGRLDGGSPAAGAPRGEILDWDPPRLVSSRLVLTPETWTTRIELSDAEGGGTRVAITVTHEPTSGSRVVRRLQRGAMQRLVQRTVDAELDKVPAHVARATNPQ